MFNELYDMDSWNGRVYKYAKNKKAQGINTQSKFNFFYGST